MLFPVNIDTLEAIHCKITPEAIPYKIDTNGGYSIFPIKLDTP